MYYFNYYKYNTNSLPVNRKNKIFKKFKTCQNSGILHINWDFAEKVYLIAKGLENL